MIAKTGAGALAHLQADLQALQPDYFASTWVTPSFLREREGVRWSTSTPEPCSARPRICQVEATGPTRWKGSCRIVGDGGTL